MNEEKQLGSWKAIGAYLERDARTVRRWEKEEGLPVHRHTHKRGSSVYAYPGEIDAWRASRRIVPEPAPARLLWKTPAFALTLILCLIMVGNGVRPVSAQQSKMSDRAVWTGPKVDLFGRVSPDGRFITYVDWPDTANLMVHDVVADTDRSLTPNFTEAGSGQLSSWSTISRDGKQVAYAWYTGYRRQDLRIVGLQGNGPPTPRQVFVGTDDMIDLAPFDWSSDGRWLAVEIKRADGTGQIALVAVADGSLRVLKSVGWNGPKRIFFSGDSKYIAYDLTAGDTSDQRDIFVMAIDGSREVAAVVHPAQDNLLGWSPDGTRLLFSSDRTGSVGLWALPFGDGKPQGMPELLRPDIGPGTSLGLTASGALYLYKSINTREVATVPIDLNKGKLSGPPSSFVQGYLPNAQLPSWSADGKYLAYSACADKNCLAVRTVDTGEVRKVRHTLLYLAASQWSPDGRSLVVSGRDSKGRDGVYRIDAQTGVTSAVVYTQGLGAFPRWSVDGKKIYYYEPSASSLKERDLASGAEREIVRHPNLGRVSAPSPDGVYLMAWVDPPTGDQGLLLVTLADGQQREFPVKGLTDSFAWTPDGQAVLALTKDGARKNLFRVPINGEAPQKLDTWPDGADGFSLSPDGRRVAFLMGKRGAEVWALENFLPATGH
jgi:Tol biopolymer transport system component